MRCATLVLVLVMIMGIFICLCEGRKARNMVEEMNMKKDKIGIGEKEDEEKGNNNIPADGYAGDLNNHHYIPRQNFNGPTSGR
ncbi:hypothetical protein G2W53_037776 [Senna tora]|uniref:Uncharacterized protein n=1 Tax=Senna tora TaxID=362788 RepID=A0A834SJT5_9FABA|nr:hypothetical protein G2W53_037776 [Senna tora]